MKIFQVWWNNDDIIPNKYQNIIDENKEILKQYNYEIYTKTKINEFLNKFGYDEKFKDYFKNVKSFYFQSDLIRFLLLYEFGGIYLDLDVKLKDNFDFLYKLILNNYSKKYNIIFPEDKHIFFIYSIKKSLLIKEEIFKYFLQSKKGEYDSKYISYFWLKNRKYKLFFISNNFLQKYLTHCHFYNLN